MKLETTDQVIVNLKYAKDLYMRGKSFKAREKLNEALQLIEPQNAQAIDDELSRLIREERI